jgi:hypothetical protein
MLLTVQKAARARNTTRYSIHRWLASGLKFRWVEGRRMISESDLAAFRPRTVGRPRKTQP